MKQDQKTLLGKVKDIYNIANQCSDHKDCVAWKLEDISKVLAVSYWCSCNLTNDQTCGSYCDTGSEAVVTLRDGNIATVYENSDTTGHG